MDSARFGVTAKEWTIVLAVVTSLALSTAAFLNSTGGVSTAAEGGKLGPGDIASGAITSRHLADDTIRSVDVRKNSLKSSDLRDNGIKSKDIGKGALKASDLDFYFATGPTVATSNNVINSSEANCRPGDSVLGGGHVWFGSQPGIEVLNAGPNNLGTREQWAIQAQNPTATPIGFQAIASCAGG